MADTTSPNTATETTTASCKSVASAEHDRLLRQAWGFAEKLAIAVCVGDAESRLAAESAHYFESVNRALDNADDWISRCDDAEIQAAISRLKERLRAAKACKLPAAEDRVKITSKVLAAPIVERVGPRNHERIVDHVDIAVEVTAPWWVKLSFDNPYEILRAEFGEKGANQRRRKTKITTWRIDSLFNKPPVWTYGLDHSVSLWLDVRPTLEPIGQVIRELKAMQKHAGEAITILVVHAKRDEIGEGMLFNEGFLTFCEEDWAPVPAD